jgi:hypothetical protein
MFPTSRIIKKRKKIDYLKKKKYNFIQNQNKENLFQQKKKTCLNQNDRHENKLVNFFKLKIEKKILRNVKGKLKSPFIKNFLFKTILLRLRYSVEDNSKSKNIFFFQHASFWYGTFIEKIFLLFFEKIFIFLEFNEKKGLLIFNLSSYSGRGIYKYLEFKEKNSQFINNFFSRRATILKKQQLVKKSIYYLNNYYVGKKTIKLIIARWMNYRKQLKYRKILKTSLLIFYNNIINIFPEKEAKLLYYFPKK